jgi:nucleoside-diphosphate-sugar epimerase
MREALEHLCDHAGTGSRVRSVPMAPTVVLMRLFSALGLSPLGPYHALMYGRSLYFDMAKARDELNWRPRFSNHEMLAQSYDWYLRHRERILQAKGASHHRSPVRQGILSLVKRCL